MLLTPDHAADSAAWFWAENGLNRHADKSDIAALARAVNGSQNGLPARSAVTKKPSQRTPNKGRTEPRFPARSAIAAPREGLRPNHTHQPVTRPDNARYTQCRGDALECAP